MFLRNKLRSVTLMAGNNKHKLYPFKYKEQEAAAAAAYTHYCSLHYLLFLLLSIWFLFLFFFFFFFSSSSSSSGSTTNPGATTNNSPSSSSNSLLLLHTLPFNDRKLTAAKPSKTDQAVCDGSVSVFVYDLPPKFNLRLLQDCQHLNVYTDMCPHIANNGLGQPLDLHMDDNHEEEGGEEEDGGRLMSSSWFATHQFIAEMIFHARVENHPCRTWEPNENSSTLFYVPFYGGLHASSKFREADLARRDRLAVELMEYLSQQPWWQRKQGRDHFLALGRTAWDFMRTDSADFGANCLLKLPQVKNMSLLTVERHPWQGSNQHGIPYPSYFHPSTLDEMLAWQNKMRVMDRPHLFSFVGAPRTGVEKAAIRDEILKQCAESTRCNLLKCGRVGASKCHSPKEVLRVMSRSQFCMQAPGDSFTRRSTFDSVLAGCIPVFFSPHTAYTQYGWYLPEEPNEYSVYIPEEKWKKMEEELLKIPKEKVERMRRKVIDLIPRLTYTHPNATHYYNKDYPDAVDLALAKLSRHVMMMQKPQNQLSTH